MIPQTSQTTRSDACGVGRDGPLPLAGWYPQHRLLGNASIPATCVERWGRLALAFTRRANRHNGQTKFSCHTAGGKASEHATTRSLDSSQGSVTAISGFAGCALSPRPAGRGLVALFGRHGGQPNDRIIAQRRDGFQAHVAEKMPTISVRRLLSLIRSNADPTHTSRDHPYSSVTRNSVIEKRPQRHSLP
jgi:hypothetical protein